MVLFILMNKAEIGECVIERRNTLRILQIDLVEFRLIVLGC